MRSLLGLLVILFMCASCIQTVRNPPPLHFWEYQTCGTLTHHALLYADRLAAFSGDGNVYCLHRETGSLIWKEYIGSSPLSSRIMKVNEEILLFVDDSTLYALDMQSGKRLWTFQALNLHDIHVNNCIYLITQASLVCLDTKGRLEWEISLTFPSLHSIRGSHRNKVFITDSPHTLTCYSGNGRIRWAYTSTDKSPITHVFIEKEGIYVGAKGIYMLNIDSGQIIWAVTQSSPLVHAVATDAHVIVRNHAAITCIDRGNGSISWEHPLSDYEVTMNAFAVAGDRLYHAEDSGTVDTIIRESDGEMILHVASHPLMDLAGTGDEILLCTPLDGLLCFDGKGEKSWSHPTNADTYQIVTDDNQAFMTGTDGRIIGLTLDQENPFPCSPEICHYSSTLGTIFSLRVQYSFDFCLELIFGEIYLVSRSDRYYVQESYEDGTVYVKGEKCFNGKEIPTDMVESLYDSITALYTDSSHVLSQYPAHVHITVEIELDTGDVITLVSGENISQFAPWEITYKGYGATQYSGQISMALCTLMNEIGWDFKEWDRFQHWGYVTHGFCRDSLSLTDLV